MKTINKNACPPKLARYAASFPDAHWEAMRNDALNGGDVAYEEARRHLVKDQKNLCAYCERKLREDAPHTIRVEHFHPKSDTITGHNWNVDWQNLLATCTGGEREGEAFPLPENLSCDASKKDEIHEGDILNPLRLPPFPAAFCYDMGTGELVPNPQFCSEHPALPGNTLSSTQELLLNTLRVLNLNCDRLCQARLKVSRYLEHQKKEFRERRIQASVALSSLTRRYLTKQWPEYFTVLRHCLQPYSEDYLHSIAYQG